MKINWRFWWCAAGVALLLFWIISDPNGASDRMHTGLGHVRDGAENIISFVSNVLK